MKRTVFFLITTFLLFLSACGTNNTRTVKIFLSAALSRDTGKDALNAVQIALNEIEGKIGNLKIELVTFDSHNPNNVIEDSVKLEIVAANQAVADPAVIAFIGGSNSAKASASLPITNKASLVMFSPFATWPGLTKPGYGPAEPGMYYPTGKRHFFRVIPSDDIQGLAAARWVSQRGVKTVYIVSDGSPYSEGLTGIFEANHRDYNITILAHGHFRAASASDAELSDLINRITAARPDAVYYPVSSYSSAPRLIAALRRADPNIKIFGGDGLVADAEDLKGDAALFEGIYATNITVDPQKLPAAADFLGKYRALTGNDMPTSPFVLSTYETTKVIIAAIRKAGDNVTRESLLQEMRSLGEFSGVFGQWRFDENGDTTLKTVEGRQFLGGQWVSVVVLE